MLIYPKYTLLMRNLANVVSPPVDNIHVYALPIIIMYRCIKCILIYSATSSYHCVGVGSSATSVDLVSLSRMTPRVVLQVECWSWDVRGCPRHG